MDMRKRVDQTLNEFYSDVLGFEVDVSKLNDAEQKQLDKLFHKALREEATKAQEFYAKVPEHERERREENAKYFELQLEKLSRQIEEQREV